MMVYNPPAKDAPDPAEACTGIGEDYDSSVPEGGAIAVTFALSVVIVAVIVIAVSGVLS